MMHDVESPGTSRPVLPGLLLAILALGSLWGLSEVAFSGFLRSSGFPYRSGVLTGIGLGVVSVGLAVYRKPLMAVGIGAVTVLVMLLSVPILHITVAEKANSSLAILIEATSLGFFSLLMSRWSGNAYTRMALGATAALAASYGFYHLGMNFVPCQYLQSFGNVGTFVVKEGLIWAAFSAVLVPLGYLAGEKLLAAAYSGAARRAYYAGALATLGLSVGISALAIKVGL